MKNVKQANINIKLKNFFYRWLEVTSMMHNLTTQQKEVLSLFLYYHYKFKREITNNKILWKVVFDYDTKTLIKNELDLKDSGLQNVLTQLRKQNIITDNVINPGFIPQLEDNTDSFKVIFNFNIINE